MNSEKPSGDSKICALSTAKAESADLRPTFVHYNGQDLWFAKSLKFVKNNKIDESFRTILPAMGHRRLCGHSGTR